jgi:hypothetical protein
MAINATATPTPTPAPTAVALLVEPLLAVSATGVLEALVAVGDVGVVLADVVPVDVDVALDDVVVVTTVPGTGEMLKYPELALISPPWLTQKRKVFESLRLRPV